jgi:phage virion morphogenesis protein
MSVRFAYSLRDSGVTLRMAGIASRAMDLRPAMDDIGRMLMASTDMRFERAVDPDGNPWVPLADSTRKRKAKAGREQILQWHGDLRRSITRRPTSTDVTVGTNLPYARAQQDGANITRYAHSREVLRTFVETNGRKELQPRFAKRNKANFASYHAVPEHNIRIPARPYVGINGDDKAGGLRILKDYVMGDQS